MYLRDSIKLAKSAKDGYLTWSEFLDFFFVKDTSIQGQDEEEAWWNKLDREGKALPPEEKLADVVEEEKDQKQNKKGGPIQHSILSPTAQRELDDKKPVAMNESLKVLQNAREDATNKDVEDEFRKLEEEKRKREGKPAPKPKKSKVPEYDSLAMMGEGYDDDEDDGGLFKREKSKNLLLQSQIEAMKAVFDRLDKYEEHILRRSEFVMAMRTDTVVIDFIDCEAVQKAYSTKTLTLDNVFMEIERDEKFE